MISQEREEAKQIEKNLKQTLKQISKEYKWSYKDSTIFKVESGLFFDAMVSYNRHNRTVSTRIAFKPFSIDDIFWDIFDMPENKKQPLSFRCFGAFTVRSFEVNKLNLELNKDDMTGICSQIINQSQKEINFILSKVYDLNTYIAYLKELFIKHKEKYPGSLTDINLELILANILVGNIEEALSINNDRLANGDRGKFWDSRGNSIKGIYEFVNEYCENIK